MTEEHSPRASQAPGAPPTPAPGTGGRSATGTPPAGRTAPRGHSGGGNAEDCPVCRPLIDQPGGVLYPWICTAADQEGTPDAT